MADFVERVQQAILADQLIKRGDQVVVAVSGGADSVALLDVLARCATSLGVALHVAHLDHQLRGASAEDARFVADLGQHLAIPTTIEAVDVAGYARQAKRSVEEAGRQTRYRFLRRVAMIVGASTVATAHHADDQAETVLLHLLRGAGLAGLRGMQPTAPLPVYPETSEVSDHVEGLRLIRPLLAMTKTEILAYLAERGLAYREDASNQDTVFTRNRVRHELLPLLQTFNPAIVETLGRTARSLADDYDALQTLVDTVWPQVVKPHDTGLDLDLAALAGLPPAIRRHLFRRAIATVSSLRDVSAAHIEAIGRLAVTGGVGEQVNLPCLRVTRTYHSLFVGQGPPPAPDWPLLPPGHTLAVAVPGVTPLPESRWALQVVAEPSPPKTVEPSPTGGYIDAALAEGGLWLRTRRPGDRFLPLGLDGHHQTLHDWMVNAKIPREVRDRIPLLVNQDHILWVVGFRFDHRTRRASDTPNRLWLEVTTLEATW